VEEQLLSFRLRRKVDSNSLLSTISGIFLAHIGKWMKAVG
jgi:hypothetical protein